MVAPKPSRRQFIAGLLTAGGVEAAPAVEPPSRPPWATKKEAYQLRKNWDFLRVIRDERAMRDEFYTRYIYANGKLDHLTGEWSRYRDNQNHVFTEEGLSLVARCPGKFGPGKIESGMLRSRWTVKYGAFEIRMRAPRGRGLWPAFWLNCEDQRWPPEIDIVEIVNNGTDSTRHSFHFLHGAGVSKRPPRRSRLGRRKSYVPGCDYSAGFHSFGAEWTPTSVNHYVDGALVASRDFLWIHNDHSDAGEAHVLVNLAVGGKWPGPPDPNIFPAALTIQHIRVWQRA